MRLSEELARIMASGRRGKRRPAGQAPREIIPGDATGRPAPAPADPFDAARDRLRAEIPPRDEAQ